MGLKRQKTHHDEEVPIRINNSKILCSFREMRFLIPTVSSCVFTADREVVELRE